MKLSDINECLITEQEVWEMASIRPSESGLPCILFVSSKGYVGGKHGPRAKISNIPGTFSSTDNFVVSITTPPVVVAGKPKYNQAELNNILDWVALNSKALLKLWNDEYETNIEFYHDLRKL